MYHIHLFFPKSVRALNFQRRRCGRQSSDLPEPGDPGPGSWSVLSGEPSGTFPFWILLVWSYDVFMHSEKVMFICCLGVGCSKRWCWPLCKASARSSFFWGCPYCCLFCTRRRWPLPILDFLPPSPPGGLSVQVAHELVETISFFVWWSAFLCWFVYVAHIHKDVSSHQRAIEQPRQNKHPSAGVDHEIHRCRRTRQDHYY